MRVAVNLATSLRARGHDVELAALALGLERSLPSHVDGIPVHLFSGRRVLPIRGFSGVSSPALWRWARRSVGHYDLVHAHLARDLVTLAVARTAQRAHVPTVLQTHGMVDPSARWSARILDTVVTRRTLREASAVLHLTDYERRDLTRVAAIEPTRLHRLPNGVPTQQIVATKCDAPTLLFLGRLHPRKRPEDVVRVAALLRERGVNVKVIIAGPDEGALAATLACIARDQLEDRVSYLGGGVDHEQALDLMRAATLLVLPSVEEPFPMTVLEALSVGLPVVITTSNGLAPDIRDTGAGRVAEPDVADLTVAVIDLLDPANHAAASRAALEVARTRFDLEMIVDQLESIYRDVVGAATTSH